MQSSVPNACESQLPAARVRPRKLKSWGKHRYYLISKASRRIGTVFAAAAADVIVRRCKRFVA